MAEAIVQIEFSGRQTWRTCQQSARDRAIQQASDCYEIMHPESDQPTIKEVLRRVMEVGSKHAAVNMSVWDEKSASNSGFSIFDGDQLFRGKTLRSALDAFNTKVNTPKEIGETEAIESEAAEIINSESAQ